MHGISAGYMLRDGAANQSAAIQWPEIMNHPKELAEIISSPATNMTCSLIFEAFVSTMFYIHLDLVILVY